MSHEVFVDYIKIQNLVHRISTDMIIDKSTVIVNISVSNILEIAILNDCHVYFCIKILQKQSIQLSKYTHPII